MTDFFEVVTTVLIVGGAASVFAVASPAGDEIGTVLSNTLSASGVVVVFVALLAVGGTLKEVLGL